MPAFMPVGTQGTVKGLSLDALHQSGTRMILANTYHLALRPGEEVVRALGGLHAFTGWDGPILTDSGGFQLFSLAQNTRVTEERAIFQSHIDGNTLELSPERAVEMYALTAIAMADAFIGCWRTKYRVNLLRPVTYIQRYIDRDWQTLLLTPPFPEYTSGHSVQSAAAAVVLTHLLGQGPFTDNIHVSLGHPPRTFPSFGAAASPGERFSRSLRSGIRVFSPLAVVFFE